MNYATQEPKPAPECFVADDERLVRDTLSLVLSLAGFHVSTFPDGSALVRAARIRVPACIILDVQHARPLRHGHPQAAECGRNIPRRSS